MSKTNVIVRIAGAAGDGIASSGELLGKTCSRMGLHVMAYNAYQSAIRGGHVWLQLNIGNEKTHCHGEEPEIVILLNKTSPALHVPQVKSGGVVFYNANKITEDLSVMRDDVTFYPLDLNELVEEKVPPVMVNTLLSGAFIQAMGLDTKVGLEFMHEKFQKKGDDVVKLNQTVFTTGIEWAKKNVKDLDLDLHGDGTKRMFLTGNDCFGMGLLAHGLKFYSAYPMSPATGILHYLATRAKKDKLIVKQVEDELAAVNWAVGASHGGARAATATAGGGFTLMIEGVGLAAMLETPLVVISVQRGGPSTGLPTKQEQADINLMMGGNGDFPRMVIAPISCEDAFFQAGRALNLAEKYQIPVLVLSDLFLSEHYETVDPFDFSKVEIQRGKIIKEQLAEGHNYKRYEVTADGVSPRLIPGFSSRGLYVAGSDEHDEHGHLISDLLAGLPSSLEIRKDMHEKRMRKQDVLRDTDAQAPLCEGPANAEFTLVGWGATYQYIQEACNLLRAEGVSINHVHFRDLFPLPKQKVLDILNSAKNLIAIENNISNQMPRLILSETGFEIKSSVNRYDGEPFTGEYIAKHVKDKINAKDLVAA